MHKVAQRSSSVVFGNHTFFHRAHCLPHARNLASAQRKRTIIVMSTDHSSQCNVHEIVTRQAHYGAFSR
jgi:hypothetical protein